MVDEVCGVKGVQPARKEQGLSCLRGQISGRTAERKGMVQYLITMHRRLFLLFFPFCVFQNLAL